VKYALAADRVKCPVTFALAICQAITYHLVIILYYKRVAEMHSQYTVIYYLIYTTVYIVIFYQQALTIIWFNFNCGNKN